MIAMHVLMFVLLAFCISMMLLFAACQLASIRFSTAGKRRRAFRLWFCRCMEWHRAPAAQGFDGCSLNGCCSVCERRVLLDSQGNWFSATQDGNYKEPVP
jgi:hypothetical protein